jgi:hypothetical protein
VSGRDGGPAFPVPFYFDQSRGEYGMYIDGVDAGAATGLTVRDYFAAKAMQAYITGALADGAELHPGDSEAVSRASYVQADSMLAAREVQP